MMIKPLVTTSRKDIIAQLKTKKFDLIVIGGGITGAGIALDAASRGMSVTLIEQKDFASGTSSKSTKLIHGGLRYLAQLDVALVREVGRERAIVHRLAPHLAVPEKLVLPLIEGGTYGYWGTMVGLKVYDILADVTGDDRRKMLNKKETLAEAPLLRAEGLNGSGFYAEYRTDDARLTIENIKTAMHHGALAINYIAAEDFSYEAGKVTAVKCIDRLTNDRFEIDATHFVSAAGPWVDELRKEDKSLTEKHLFLSKGAHIVVPHERFPLKHTMYFDVPDGRMMFAIPRHRVTYIGTTDTPFKGDKNHVYASKEDVDYILKGTNAMFPTANLRLEDVESSWAGLRPLIYEEGKSGSEMSRKDEIFVSPTGLVSIAGGKLTGYRKMAERIVNLVNERSKEAGGKDYGATKTASIKLVGGAFENYKAVEKYQETIAEKLKKINIPIHYAELLVANYGKQTDAILATIPENTNPEIALARAELQHCFKYELVSKPLDFLDRRSGRLYFNIVSIIPMLEVILADFATQFAWNGTRIAAEKAGVLFALEAVSTFKSEAEMTM